MLVGCVTISLSSCKANFRHDLVDVEIKPLIVEGTSIEPSFQASARQGALKTGAPWRLQIVSLSKEKLARLLINEARVQLGEHSVVLIAPDRALVVKYRKIQSGESYINHLAGRLDARIEPGSVGTLSIEGSVETSSGRVLPFSGTWKLECVVEEGETTINPLLD